MVVVRDRGFVVCLRWPLARYSPLPVSFMRCLLFGRIRNPRSLPPAEFCIGGDCLAYGVDGLWRTTFRVNGGTGAKAWSGLRSLVE